MSLARPGGTPTRGSPRPPPQVTITGASSGIGRAAAVEFARRGARLLLAARSLPGLLETADACRAAGAPEVRVKECDVTREGEVRALALEAGLVWGDACDVLVANAGVGHYGAFLDMSARDVARVMDTNVMGVFHAVHAFGPLLEKARGHVIVVGSQAGKTPVPLSSVYAASKWALTGWTRSVRPELEARGISITLLSPGGVDTTFKDKRLRAANADDRAATASVPGSQSVEHVARKLVDAARRRPAEVDLTLVGAVGRVANAVAPHFAARSIMRARGRK